MLVVLIASIVVILEGWLHFFSVADQLSLAALRVSGLFSLKVENAVLTSEACTSASQKYFVLLVPNVSRLNGAIRSADAVREAEIADFPFRVVQAVYEAGPRILAVDLDLSLNERSPDRATLLSRDRDSNAPNYQTRLALVALPLSDVDSATQMRRETRNTWLTQMCRSRHVVLASPRIGQSTLFGDVVQFYGSNFIGNQQELPRIYPGLGQLVHELDRDIDASAVRGPGYLCNQLRGRSSDVRIPFLDAPVTVREQIEERFAIAESPFWSFGLEWINPGVVKSQVRVLRVSDSSQLTQFIQKNQACLPDKIVFVGTDRFDLSHDVFATFAGNSTPGVLVHAMVAASTEHAFRGALALSAVVDIFIGMLLVTIIRRLHHDKWIKSDSFVLRNVGKVLVTAAPLVALIAIVLLTAILFLWGWFFNPLVALFGVWLHSVFEKFFNWSASIAIQTSEAKSFSHWIRKLFPRPDQAKEGFWRIGDPVVYWSLVCTYLLIVGCAIYIVGSRLRIDLV